MWRSTVLFALFCCAASAQETSDQLVSGVIRDCVDMGCVKTHVLSYLDNMLNVQSDARSIQNIDQAIFKRAARVLNTHEFRFQLPETLFGGTQLIYNPKTGMDITETQNEERALGLKKKLLLPILLLFKLKMKALMPIFVALIGLKALKALILSKLAIGIVVAFIIYQFISKSGMPMPLPMTMTPVEPPTSMYGPPSTSPPNSYEPGWEPSSGGGPYARIWTGSSSNGADSAQNLAYSAYYPGSSSTTSP